MLTDACPLLGLDWLAQLCEPLYYKKIAELLYIILKHKKRIVCLIGYKDKAIDKTIIYPLDDTTDVTLMTLKETLKYKPLM